MSENQAVSENSQENGLNSGQSGGDGQGRGPIITPAMAGAIIMVSVERVRQLSRDGWIRKTGKGYHLLDVVQGYIRFRDDADRRANKTAAASRVSDARAREIELRNAQREGRLIEIDDALDAVDKLVGTMRVELAGLPARVTRDLQLRRTIETAINDILQRISDIAEQSELDVRKSEAAGEAVASGPAGSVGSEEQNAPSDDGSSRAA